MRRPPNIERCVRAVNRMPLAAEGGKAPWFRSTLTPRPRVVASFSTAIRALLPVLTRDASIVDDGIGRLRIVGAHERLRRGQIRRRELGLDRVATAHGLRIAPAPGKAVPLVGPDRVPRHAKTVFDQNGEIILAVLEAAFGGLREPSRRRCIVGRARLPAGTQNSKIMHCLDVALLGCALIPDARPLHVCFGPETALVERG